MLARVWQTRCHNVVRNAMHRHCKEVGISALVEHQLPSSSQSSSSSSQLRLDLYIPGAYGLDPRGLSLDVTVAHPHGCSLVSLCALSSGATSPLVERVKNSHYEPECREDDFSLLRVGIGVFGAFGAKGSTFFRRPATSAAGRCE